MNTETLIRSVRAENQPPPPHCTATILEVRAEAVELRVAPDVDVTPNRQVELAIHGRWSLGRIEWSRPGVRDAVIACVRLTPRSGSGPEASIG
ncbi:MAG TPA: hypothetical protein VID94_15910 [Acidimicrobiales bacterium]